MKGVLDNAPIPIPCTRCGTKTKKTIGWVKSNSQFACSCGATVRFDASQLIGEMGKVDDAFAKFQDSVKKFGK